jgi:hypothetical protein
VLPALEVTVPRWLILAHGGGCVLLVLLALLLSRPWRQLQSSGRQQHRPLEGVNAAGGTWLTYRLNSNGHRTLVPDLDLANVHGGLRSGLEEQS